MSEDEPRIDTVTIARLFHSVAFPDQTRITKKTLQLVSEYTRLFTEEAIVRANDYRVEEKRQLAKSYRTEESGDKEPANDDGSLDARHLEAIAGLLVLDF